MTVESVHNKEHNKVNKADQSQNWTPINKQSSGVNYVLVVLEVMQNMGLGPIQDIMNTEAKMMDVTAKIQTDLTTIQQYLSKVENMAKSGGAYGSEFKGKNFGPGQDGSYSYGPNGFNGLDSKEFHENLNPNGDLNNQYVSADFQQATAQFIAAMKDLYMCQPCTAGDPDSAANFSKFSINKTDGKGNPITEKVDISGNFDTLNNHWFASSGVKTFSTSSTAKASLVQKYMFYKTKLAAEQHTGPLPINTQTGTADISKLGVNFDPNSDNFDGMGKSLFGLVSSFNTHEDVKRSADGTWRGEGRFRTESNNFLSYIFKNPYEIDNSDPHLNSTFVNIYGAVSFAAFNYYWSKNPNASVSVNDNTMPKPDPYNGQGYDWQKNKGVANGDDLSTWYSSAQSSSSIVSSTSSESSTDMQEMTSEVSQFQNIGQNIIKSSSQSNLATVQNYKSA